MKYVIKTLELIDNDCESYSKSKSSNQCIIIYIEPTQCQIAGKNIKVFENQHLFFDLKKLFSDISPNDQGEKILEVNETNFPESQKYIKDLTTVIANLDNIYYKYTNDKIDCCEDGSPIIHTSIPIFTLRTKLHEGSDEIMYPIGTPEEIKNTHLKRKYILANEYNKKV